MKIRLSGSRSEIQHFTHFLNKMRSLGYFDITDNSKLYRDKGDQFKFRKYLNMELKKMFIKFQGVPKDE